MKIFSPLASAQIRDEWAANSRLRLAVLTILVLLVFYAAREAIGWQQAWQENRNQSHKELLRLQATVAQSDWHERAETTASSAMVAEQVLWRAETLGVAQARVQSELERLAVQSGVSVDIRVSSPGMDLDNRFAKIPVTIQGQTDVASLLAFIAALETSPKLFVVRRLDASAFKTGNGRFFLTVDAWFSPFGATE